MIFIPSVNVSTFVRVVSVASVVSVVGSIVVVTRIGKRVSKCVNHVLSENICKKSQIYNLTIFI